MFTPAVGQTKSVVINLALASRSIGEELKSILDLLPLPLHVRVGKKIHLYSLLKYS